MQPHMSLCKKKKPFLWIQSRKWCLGSGRLKSVVTCNTTQRKREKNKKKGITIEREKESDEEIH